MADTLRQTMLNVVSRDDTNDMTIRQFCVLCCLTSGWRTVRDLAEATTLGKPAISRAADRLEAMGFAERIDDPDDRRSVLISMTSAGKRFLTAVTQGIS